MSSEHPMKDILLSSFFLYLTFWFWRIRCFNVVPESTGHATVMTFLRGYPAGCRQPAFLQSLGHSKNSIQRFFLTILSCRSGMVEFPSDICGKPFHHFFLPAGRRGFFLAPNFKDFFLKR